ncbi:MAG: lipocalin-like domain-containing protein [Candidatus Methylomirabilales bacterium]
MIPLRKSGWWPVLLVLGLLAGAEAQEYRRALPGYRFQFPRDHFSHPGFKTEWWYYTGHLKTGDGGRYGYQLTFFRVGTEEGEEVKNPSRWAVRDLFLAHFAVSDLNRRRFHFTDRLNRAALGTAGASTKALKVWNGNWGLEAEGEAHRLQAKDEQYAVDLTLTPVKPPVIHGKDGVSQKGEGFGYASHYYSLSRLRTTGTITVHGRTRRVEGWSWMDHEFGSNQLHEYQEGWDWFGLQLDNGLDLMFYLMRQKGGRPDPYSSGTLILPDGKALHLPLSQVRVRATGTWKSPRSKATYPMGWEIRIPQHGVFLTVTPSFPDQELDTRKSTKVIYWEGSVRVRGTYQETPVSGQGYVEMTGYAGRFHQRI